VWGSGGGGGGGGGGACGGGGGGGGGGGKGAGHGRGTVCVSRDVWRPIYCLRGGPVGVRVCHEHASTVVRRVSCAAVYSLVFLAAAWMSVDGSGGGVVGFVPLSAGCP